MNAQLLRYDEAIAAFQKACLFSLSRLGAVRLARAYQRKVTPLPPGKA